MGRPLRVDPVNGMHHVVNRGGRRREVFLCDADRRLFLRLLAKVYDRFGVETVAYCLMGNHYHLILHCPDGRLSEAMQYLGSLYTKEFNERHGYDGALFKGRFWSRLIDTDAYLLAAATYVHRNPTELGSDPFDYPWSNLKAMISDQGKPEPWLRTDRLLKLTNGTDQYRRLVAHQSKGTVEPERPRFLVVEGPRLGRYLDRLDKVMHRAASTVRRRDGRGNVHAGPLRRVAALLAVDSLGVSGRVAAKHYGFSSRNTLAAALASCRLEMSSDPLVRELYSAAVSRLHTIPT